MDIPTVHLLSDGRIVSMAMMPQGTSTIVDNMPGTTVISVADYDTMLAAPGQWRYVAGTLTAGWGIAVDMAPLIKRAQGRVDVAAEAARLTFITPGSGQALEYQATQTQALAAAAAADPLDVALYPWLVAEQSAQAAAGVTVTLRTVATQVIALTNAWETAGAAIKETRRAAKLQIAAATTEAQIQTILAAITWPVPPGTPAPSPPGTPAMLVSATAYA